ncbi:CesT family type III secretion system chaperone [Thalassospira sp.]|uniref:CesT family type III secretion system chaperone n=1 Tax=Thalassospira sp. TaxID=1912094 RepID=UPI0025ECF0C1|nr:CesT family type III secretion system chaperone [Thalassospira sp.]
MNWIEETLKRFGEEIGIENLGLSELADGRNGLVLDFDDGERSVCFEQAGDDLLVYLSRHIQHVDDAKLAEALSFGNYKNTRTAGIQAALRGENTLVFLTRISAAQVSHIKLEQSLELLQSAHEALDGR